MIKLSWASLVPVYESFQPIVLAVSIRRFQRPSLPELQESLPALLLFLHLGFFHGLEMEISDVVMLRYVVVLLSHPAAYLLDFRPALFHVFWLLKTKRGVFPDKLFVIFDLRQTKLLEDRLNCLESSSTYVSHILAGRTAHVNDPDLFVRKFWWVNILFFGSKFHLV